MNTCKNYTCTNDAVQLYLRIVSASSEKFSESIAVYCEAAHTTNPFDYEREVVQETFITPLEFSKDILGKYDRDFIIGLIQTANIFADKAFNYYFSSSMAYMHHVAQEEYINICDKACDALSVISAWVENADRMFAANPELISGPRTAVATEFATAYEGVLARIDIGVLFVALGRFFSCLNQINLDIEVGHKYSLKEIVELYSNTLKYLGVFAPGNLFI